MADNSRRGNQRTNTPRNGDANRRSTIDPGADDLLTPHGDLRPSESRFSLNEQFAISRREFEFEEDDDSLEPAPVIPPYREPTETQEVQDEDTLEDISDSEIHRILNAADETLDYYTLLGLSRENSPSTSQIRGAYHRLSLAFHPDRHPQSLKASAERHFTRLQKAYETLIDPRRRVIYDLEGEEGLQNEYRPGGSMGQGGEAERQIGVKTMKADEFKEWFLSILRERERRAIHDLVDTSSICKITLDASPLFTDSEDTLRFKASPTGNETDSRLIEIPAPKVAAQLLQVRHGFSIPLPGLGRALRTPVPSLKALIEILYRGSDEEEDQHLRSSWRDAARRDVPTLTFTGGVTGNLKKVLALQVDDIENPNQSEPKLSPLQWYSLNSDKMELSARLEHSFSDPKPRDGSIASKLQGTELDITTGLFPSRTMSIGVGRLFTPIENTTPFYSHLKANFNHPLSLKPPSLDLRISRSLGGAKVGYLQASSGDFMWPTFLAQRFPFFSKTTYFPRGQGAPNMKLGYVWTESVGALADQDEEDDTYSFQQEEGIPVEGSEKSTANQAWHVSVDATSFMASISVRYGRDIFVRKYEPPVRSRIRNSGEAIATPSRPQLRSSKGLRLELGADIDLLLQVSTSMRAARRVGEFSTVGISVGMNSSRGGLYIAFSWSRLGQNLVLPVILLPPDEVTSRAVFFAMAVPWAAYAALEFVFLRPRAQRKRKRLIERKRKELKENVDKRRAEAEQAVQLMKPIVGVRQAVEFEQGGLVILNASYGVRKNSRKPEWAVGEVADVTEAVAALVADGQLSLPRGIRKDQIIGFYDPAPLKKKTLAVRYLYDGKEHYVEVSGNEALAIPMRAHEV